jgi:diacylglycerol kinase family enzyme
VGEGRAACGRDGHKQGRSGKLCSQARRMGPGEASWEVVVPGNGDGTVEHVASSAAGTMDGCKRKRLVVGCKTLEELEPPRRDHE